MKGWTEIADGVFQRRYAPLDVTVGVVRGADGLLLVDTRSSHREADEVRRDLRALGPAPLRWVVNTHAHYDHSFGNARFARRAGADGGAPIVGHRRLPAHLDAHERPRLAEWVASGAEPAADWREVVITPPDVLVDVRLTIDLGDRAVDLLHLGRGHTDHDLLVAVPAADAWFAGDLVEESGPPMYGSGSCPLDWPGTLARLVQRLSPATTVVPGHGAPVDVAFVRSQQRDLAAVADVIAALHRAGVPADEAVVEGAGRWPWPDEVVGPAVADAYRQLAAGGDSAD